MEPAAAISCRRTTFEKAVPRGTRRLDRPTAGNLVLATFQGYRLNDNLHWQTCGSLIAYFFWRHRGSDDCTAGPGVADRVDRRAGAGGGRRGPREGHPVDGLLVALPQ